MGVVGVATFAPVAGAVVAAAVIPGMDVVVVATAASLVADVVVGAGCWKLFALLESNNTSSNHF